MKVITVNTSSAYPVMVGTGLIDNVGNIVRDYTKAETVAIVTDDNVDRFYGGRVEESLVSAGYKTVKYVFPHGEEHKNAENYIALLNFLADNYLTRSDMIVALGGGVVGDLSGFAAATYLRKIDFIQIPTSLLAAVDSSVGGKTAIDLNSGKNLAGAFYQPKLVLCDLDTLKTLPEYYFTDGCGEVIKYGVLGDEKLFDHLAEKGRDFDLEYVVTRCIEMKRDIVVEDEFESGKRQLLNFGHTLGHAVEACSNYELSHGRCVAIGMAAVTKAAAKKGICNVSCAERMDKILAAFELPAKCEFSIDELYDVMMSDKKRKGGSISIVVPERIGECVITRVPMEDMKEFMKAGL